MIRKAIRLVVVPLVAAVALSSVAEAAPRKNVRHRPKHSSRVSAGAPAESQGEPGATKTSGSRATSTKSSSSSKSKSTTAKKSTATGKTTKRTTAKRKPSTKPQ